MFFHKLCEESWGPSKLFNCGGKGTQEKLSGIESFNAFVADHTETTVLPFKTASLPPFLAELFWTYWRLL